MDTEKLNRWLTLTANFAVVIGIVFVAYEIQQNNELLKAEARQAWLENRVSSISEFVQNTDLVNSLALARAGEDLAPAEHERLMTYYLGWFVRWEWEHEQASLGVVDNLYGAEIYKSTFHSYPLTDEAWAMYRSVMSPEFVEYAEQYIVPK